jgi:uncharacterized protein (TIGR03435 family)
LIWLIREAYGLQEHQIVGLPGATAGERFDVMARTETGKSGAYREMLKNLLADRFGLKAHVETRQGTTYNLAVSREGTLGPKLTPTTVTDCVSESGTNRSCGTHTSNMTMTAVSVRMPQLATQLSPFVGRAVIDTTGLDGAYDLEFGWTSDARRPPLAGDDGPSIFTALQEQLGLKLDAQKGPVEVLVIDRVEQPTAD